MVDTYPVPVEPADGTILALNGTTHQKTGLKFIAQGVGPTSSPSLRIQADTQLRRMFELLAEQCQGYVVETDTLEIGVYPIYYTLDGTQKYPCSCITEGGYSLVLAERLWDSKRFAFGLGCCQSAHPVKS
jgi:hypothetical protein